MKAKKIFSICVASLLLTACGNDPENVAKQYWQGLIDHDRAAVTEASQSSSSQELWRLVSPDKGSEVSFGETTIEENTAAIETQLIWIEADQEEPVELSLYTVLELEDETWKVNTSRTRRQFFTAVYRNSLDGLSAALAETLAEFQVLGEDVAIEFTNELDRTILELQQQSNQANDGIQAFLNNIDGELKDAIEAANE